MALEKREGKGGRTYWWKVPMSEFEVTSAPVIDVSGIDVPEDHADMLNFIHSSYKLKPQGFGDEGTEMEIFSSVCCKG